MSSLATEARATHAGQRSATATQGRFGALLLCIAQPEHRMESRARSVSRLCTGDPSQPYKLRSAIGPSRRRVNRPVQLTATGARRPAVCCRIQSRARTGYPPRLVITARPMHGQRMSSARGSGSVSPTRFPRILHDSLARAVADALVEAPAWQDAC